MPPTAADVFTDSVKTLPPTEKLRLAALILDDLAKPSLEAIDISDSWSREDELDLSAFTLRYAEETYPEDETLV
jgi:hypothetical protein